MKKKLLSNIEFNKFQIIQYCSAIIRVSNYTLLRRLSLNKISCRGTFALTFNTQPIRSK